VKTFRTLLITSLMTIPGLFAYGQQTEEVTGTVTDATGALVAGANDPRNLATFDVITSAGPMRQLQFALKYSF
jgi:hypothetical protein